MARNNLPKLKQLQGGLQLQRDVTSLLPILTSYEASKVTTSILKPDNVTYYKADEILTILANAKSTFESVDENLQSQLTTLQSTPISDFIRLTGTITVTPNTVVDPDTGIETTTYTTTPTWDEPSYVQEVIPTLDSNTTNIYTEDNRPIVNDQGQNIKFNFITGTISGAPCTADYSGDEITYVPWVGENIKFKVFPIATYTLSNLPQRFLLDNEELNLVYYSTAIDQLAFNLSKNSDIIAQVQALVGTTAISTLLADLTETLQTQITANRNDITTIMGDDTVAGSIAYAIKTAKTALDLVDEGLDTRLTTVEGILTVLQGADTVTGSIAQIVKAHEDAFRPRIVALESAINTYEGNASVPGSIAARIKEVTDPISARVTTNADNISTNTADIATLNGNSSVEGSVDYKIAQAIAQVDANADDLDDRITSLESRATSAEGRLDTAEQDILDLQGVDETLAGRIDDNDADITALQTTVDRLDTKEETWDANTSYTNATAMITGVGGLEAGTTFNNVPIKNLLDELLYPYVKPELAVTISPSTNTILEKGDTVNVVDINATVTKKSKPITNVRVYKDNTVVKNFAEDNEVVANGGAHLYSESDAGITSNTTYKVDVNDGKQLVTSANYTYKFVYPYYIGKVANSVASTSVGITDELIRSLTKVVAEPTATIPRAFDLNDEKVVIALPSGWALKSILDPNSFEVLSSFTHLTQSVSANDGTTQNYNVYVMTQATTQSNYTYKFIKA